MSRLLLVEDDTSLGATLQERLLREGYFVEWAENAAAAKKLFEKNEFDLAILDIGLPLESGFELAEWIKERSVIPFIFVTAMTTAEYRLKGFEIGAEEYIPKPFHLKEILLRVRHVLENHAVKRFANLGDLKIDFQSHNIIHPGGREVRLHPRDAQILKLLADHFPAVVSRDDILNKLWGHDKFPSERTVDNCIVRLRQALEDEKGEIIRSVRGVGYQLEKRPYG